MCVLDAVTVTVICPSRSALRVRVRRSDARPDRNGARADAARTAFVRAHVHACARASVRVCVRASVPLTRVPVTQAVTQIVIVTVTSPNRSDPARPGRPTGRGGDAPPAPGAQR